MTISACVWPSPPQNLLLPANAVHVWCADLDLSEIRLQHLRQTVSVDENNRADRFYFDRHRKRFIAAHGILREILGRYLEVKPEWLEYSYGSRGKPAIAGMDSDINFNLSHKNNFALCAVTRNRLIGIDIEFLRPVREVESLAENNFCPQEFEVIRSLPSGKKEEAFFNAWTRKEAYLKATGEGLAGLGSVEVSLVPGEPAAVLRIEGAVQTARRWSMRHLLPAQGYVAALAVEGRDWNLSCFKVDCA